MVARIAPATLHTEVRTHGGKDLFVKVRQSHPHHIERGGILRPKLLSLHRRDIIVSISEDPDDPITLTWMRDGGGRSMKLDGFQWASPH
jgi:hypothetical protein